MHESGKSTVSTLLRRALARHLGSVRIRVLVIWHPMTHTTVASFVWAWSTHAISLRGRFVCIVSSSLWRSSALACPSFRGKRGSRLLPAIQDPPLPRHGDVWEWGCWDWTLSNLLPCVRRAVGCYGTRHGKAWLAVGANQNGGAARTPWWAISFWT